MFAYITGKNFPQLQENLHLNQRIDMIFYENVKSLLLGLSILFFMFSLGIMKFHLYGNGLLAGSYLGTSILFTLSLITLIKKKIPRNLSHIMAVVIQLILELNILLSFSFTNHYFHFITMGLLLIGSSIFFLKLRWFIFSSFISLVFWISALFLYEYQSIRILNVIIGIALPFSIVINYLRRSAFETYQKMFISNLSKNKKLKNLLEVLQESESSYRTLVENVSDIFISLNKEGFINYINQTVKNNLGFEPEELLATDIADIFAKDDQNRFREFFANVSNQMNYGIDLQLESKSGKLYWYRIKLQPNYESKEPSYTGIFYDINEQKKAEQDLMVQKAYLEELFDHSPEGIALINTSGRILRANPEFSKIFGFNKDETLGSFIGELIVPESLTDEFNKNHNQVLENKIVNIETTRLHKNGSLIDVSIIGMSIKVEERIVGSYIIYRDISQRKKNEKELKSLYNRLVSELDTASSVQKYLLPSWLTMNQNLILTSTYKASSQIGGDLFDLIPINDHQHIVYVGDISGHGVQAALMMTAVKSIINMLISNEKTHLHLPYIVDRLNKTLSRDLFNKSYLTLLICLVDSKYNTLQYYNAGHPPLLWLKERGKTIKYLDEKGSIPIGWKETFQYEDDELGEINFGDDDVFLLYTDGIFECVNPDGEQLGMKGLEEIISEQLHSPDCLIIPHHFQQILADRNYDINQDDFTLLAIRKNVSSKDSDKVQKIFKIKSLLENTGPIGNECEKLVQQYTGDSLLSQKVELVVNEYLNNIIEHGLRLKKDTSIAFRIEIKNRVTLTFWDNGTDWELPEWKEDDIAAADKFRGMGMQIVYQLCDTIKKDRFAEINEAIIEFEISDNSTNNSRD